MSGEPFRGGRCTCRDLTAFLARFGRGRSSFALIIAVPQAASSPPAHHAGTVLGLFNFQSMGVFGYTAAVSIGAWLLLSIIRSGKL